jgi:hypothetical protein
MRGWAGTLLTALSRAQAHLNVELADKMNHVEDLTKVPPSLAFYLPLPSPCPSLR